jgi:diacylglycerol kinase (ATP)
MPMKFKNIHFILNPAAGSDEPILSHINSVLDKSGINWDISITKKAGDAAKMARELLGKTDLIAVYGGDGSLAEVAGAIYSGETPMAIIPGGTANVVAKELGIPLDTVKALQLLCSGKTTIANMDMGVVNRRPFIIRVNLGIMADMIINADRGLKDTLGQAAYGVTGIKSMLNTKPLDYNLIIDGQKVAEKGVALTVTNCGSLGISGFNLLPGISATDGMLDVVLMNDEDFISVLKIAGSTLFQTGSNVLKHWRCRQVTISLTNPVHYICDDMPRKAKKLNIKILPEALKIIVPAV